MGSPHPPERKLWGKIQFGEEKCQIQSGEGVFMSERAAIALHVTWPDLGERSGRVHRGPDAGEGESPGVQFPALQNFSFRRRCHDYH